MADDRTQQSGRPSGTGPGPAPGAAPALARAPSPAAREVPKDRRALAEQYIPYVRSIAGKVKRTVAAEVPYEDLVEYGMIGLLEAADRYDPAHGANFMTFAYYRIRGAIYDGLRGMGWMSRADYARARFEERANHYLADVALRAGPPGLAPDPAERGRRTTGGEQAEPIAGASPLETAVQGLATAVHGLAAVYITSLDGVQAAALRDDKTPLAEDSLALEQARSLVRATIRKLGDQERQLLELYYYKNLSLQEVGDKLGLSKSWTSRLHARVIEKLHRMLEDDLPPG